MVKMKLNGESVKMKTSAIKMGIIIAALSFVYIFCAFNLAAAAPPCYITQWGGYGSGNGQFKNCNWVAISGGNIFVTELGWR